MRYMAKSNTMCHSLNIPVQCDVRGQFLFIWNGHSTVSKLMILLYFIFYFFFILFCSLSLTSQSTEANHKFHFVHSSNDARRRDQEMSARVYETSEQKKNDFAISYADLNEPS